MKDAFAYCKNGHRNYLTAQDHHVKCCICGEIARRPLPADCVHGKKTLCAKCNHTRDIHTANGSGSCMVPDCACGEGKFDPVK